MESLKGFRGDPGAKPWKFLITDFATQVHHTKIILGRVLRASERSSMKKVWASRTNIRAYFRAALNRGANS